MPGSSVNAGTCVDPRFPLPTGQHAVYIIKFAMDRLIPDSSVAVQTQLARQVCRTAQYATAWELQFRVCDAPRIGSLCF